MSKLNLSPVEYRFLREQIRETKQIKILKRAQIILLYNEGVSVASICKQFLVPRKTVYNWISQYKERRNESIINRLVDRPHPGRPPEKKNAVIEALKAVIEKSPKDFGYKHSVWTALLLAKHLEKIINLSVSHDTVRRCLKEMNYVCKRPRYTLARQPKTWKHSKGGSFADSRIAEEH